MTQYTIDQSQKVAVFGYGSLVNLESLARTIGRIPDSTHYVMLNGWIRDWSVKCQNNLQTGRYVLLDDQQVPEHVVALNIQQREGQAVNGILFAVTPEEIAALDVREFVYDRIDVTHAINGDHPFETVYTYTAQPEWIVSETDAVIVPECYALLVEEGFKILGKEAHEHYVASTIPSILAPVPSQFVRHN